MSDRSVNDMVAINNTINKIINSPQKDITVSEAKKVLRECGILNGKNQIKPAYKSIIKESVLSNAGK